MVVACCGRGPRLASRKAGVGWHGTSVAWREGWKARRGRRGKAGATSEGRRSEICEPGRGVCEDGDARMAARGWRRMVGGGMARKDGGARGWRGQGGAQDACREWSAAR